MELTRVVSISFELCASFRGEPISDYVAEMRRVSARLTQMFANHDMQVEVLVIDFRGKQWSKCAFTTEHQRMSSKLGSQLLHV